MSIYIKSSDVPGKVTAKGRENTFELLTCTYGVTRTIGSRVGKSNADGGIAVISEIVCTKLWDSSSTKLFQNAFAGTALAKMEIVFTRQDASESLVYLKLELEKVIVSSYELSAAGGEASAVPTETFTLNYGKINVTGTPPKADGTPDSPASTGWDVLLNTKV
jgi:type VI secretion system secreted protein Hcp